MIKNILVSLSLALGVLSLSECALTEAHKAKFASVFMGRAAQLSFWSISLSCAAFAFFLLSNLTRLADGPLRYTLSMSLPLHLTVCIVSVIFSYLHCNCSPASMKNSLIDTLSHPGKWVAVLIRLKDAMIGLRPRTVLRSCFFRAGIHVLVLVSLWAIRSKTALLTARRTYYANISVAALFVALSIFGYLRTGRWAYDFLNGKSLMGLTVAYALFLAVLWASLRAISYLETRRRLAQIKKNLNKKK